MNIRQSSIMKHLANKIMNKLDDPLTDNAEIIGNMETINRAIDNIRADKRTNYQVTDEQDKLLTKLKEATDYMKETYDRLTEEPDIEEQLYKTRVNIFNLFKQFMEYAWKL